MVREGERGRQRERVEERHSERGRERGGRERKREGIYIYILRDKRNVTPVNYDIYLLFFNSLL